MPAPCPPLRLIERPAPFAPRSSQILTLYTGILLLLAKRLGYASLSECSLAAYSLMCAPHTHGTRPPPPRHHSTSTRHTAAAEAAATTTDEVG